MSIVIGLGNSDEQPKWQDPLGLYGGKAPDFSTQAQPAQQSTAPAASWADNERDQNDIINTVIGEAAGEGDQGMAAVASVIRNRAAARGLSPADVVRQPDQFTAYAHPGSAVRKEMTDPALRERATLIVNSIFDGSTPDPTGGADHYHATSVSPSWAQSMPETTRVGNHIFYRSGKAAAPAREKTNAIAYNGDFKDSLGLYGGNDPFSAILKQPGADQDTATAKAQEPAAVDDDASQYLLSRLQPGHPASYVTLMKPALRDGIAAMLRDAPDEVKNGVQLMSGARSPERQAQIIAENADKYGIDREAWLSDVAAYGPVDAGKKWRPIFRESGMSKSIGAPGTSKHQLGVAADLGWNGGSLANAPKPVIDWLHANAARYGLRFPLANENWHIETADARSGAPAPNAQPVTSDSAEMRPFKPGETRPNADGSYSTEISTTWQLPDGKWVNVPSLWMGPKGPVQFKTDDEQSILGNMQQYEAQHGQTFQRFDTEQQAVTAAKQRSAAGGAGAGPQTAGGIAVDRNWKPSDPMNMYPDGNPIQQAAQSQFAKQDADEASAAAQAEQNRMRGIAEQHNAAVGDQLEQLNKDNPGRYQAVDQSQVGDWQKKWNDENKSSGILGDTKRMLVKGTAGFLQDLDSLADTVFPHIPGGKQFLEASDKIDTWLIGKPLADRMQDVSDRADASVTDRQKEADAKNWWDSKNGRLGSAWSDPRSYLRVTAESAPSTAITMLPGGIMARGVFVRGIAAGLTEREAAAAAAKTAAIAGGITEGLQAGGNSARSVRDRIAEIPREQLVQSEAVQQLVKGGLSEDDAVKAVTEDAATQAMLVTGVATGIFGGQGDRVLAKIIGEGISGNIAKRVAAGAAKGFVGEGLLEELPQNVAQQVSENAAVQRVDPKQDLTEGVGEAVASGIAGGGAMGAGMGGAGGAVSRAHGHEAVQEHDAEATTPAPAEPAAAPQTAAAGPIGRAVKHASEQATRRNEPKFVVDDGAVGNQPAGPLNGQTVTVAPDQSGVPANMRRVITSDGTESTIGNGLLKPADKPTPAKPPVPDGAPEIGATVQVDHEGVEPFMASVDGYEGDEAILIDRGSGEVYQVPISSISQIAPSPETAQRNAEAAQRAASGQPAPESDPALEPVAPKAAEVKTEPLPPRSEQKPATEAMPRAPGPGESIIVDNQRAGRFVGKVKSWENGGTEALVTDPNGNDFQVPVSDLYVNKLTEKQVEDQDLKRNPPVEREIADAGPNSRKVFGKTVVLPDDLHARLYDLGKERFVSKKAGGNSQLDLGRVNSPELTKLATDFGISPTDLGSMADDYRYRVDRSAKEARTTLPINMAQVNERRLKQWQSKNAKAAALPDDLGNWWDVQLTEPERKAALAKAGIKRSEKVMWGGFTPNLQKKLAAVREETIGETAAISDTNAVNPNSDGQIADTAPAKTDSAAQAELSTQNPEITIEQRDDDILLKRTDGAAHLSVKPVGKDLKIGIASASKAIRGQGKTRALYEEAIRLAGERGGVLRSDMVVSHDATHIYDALKRRGYDVERNPKAENGHRGLISPSAAPDNWVFKVKPKPAESTAAGASTDTAAHEAATSPQNELPQPTQAQKEAGNYQKGHIRLGGLDISIENPAGSERSGTDASGKPWSVEMKSHYGYIRGTVGKDKDHVDVFVKPGTEQLDDNAPVFVIDQRKANGHFDEHKVMLGFDDREAAEKAYQENYADGWKGMGPVTETTLGDFKDWLKNADTTQRYADQPLGLAEDLKEGAFGPVLHGYEGKWREAALELERRQNGDAIGALHHPDVGPIDLVWGKPGTNQHNGYGLSKLIAWHPEVLGDLQGFINRLSVDSAQSTPRRIQLRDATGRAGIRLDYDGKAKSWLLTAFDTQTPRRSEKNSRSLSELWGERAGNGAISDTATAKPSDANASRRTGTRRTISEAAGKVQLRPPAAQSDRVERIAATSPSAGKRPKRPQSLFDFLAAEGGVKDEGGEIANMGLRRKFVPGRGALVRQSGMSLDKAREAAAQAGYFHHLYGTPEEATSKTTISDLLDLMDEEARGSPAYSLNDADRVRAIEEYEAALANRAEYRRFLQDIDDTISQLGGDITIDDGVLARAAEYMLEDNMSPLDAFDRAVIEDERSLEASLNAKGREPTREGNDGSDIPFFDDEARTTEAALGSVDASGENGRSGRRAANAPSSRQSQPASRTAEARERVKPKSPDPKVRPTKGKLVDLVPPERPTDKPIGDWARDQVLSIGKKTGHEYLVAIDDDGSIVGYGTAGRKDETGINDRLLSAMANPDRALVIYHNHPNNSPISVPDIAMLSLPGIHAVYSLGHEGLDMRVALSPEAREALSARDYARSAEVLIAGLEGAREAARRHLQSEFDAGRLTPADASRADVYLPTLLAHRAGIIDFSANSLYDPRSIDGLDQRISDAAQKLAKDFFNDPAAAIRSEGVRRSSIPVGHVADLEAVGEERQLLGGRRSGPEGLSEGSAPDYSRKGGEGRKIADDQVMRSVSERQIVSKVKQTLDGKSTDIQPLLLKTVPLNYFPELAGDKIPAIADYLHVKRAMDAFRGRKHDASVKIIDQWRKLISKGYVLTDQSRASQIADLMHDTTLAGVDPSLTTDEEKAKPGYADLRKRFTALPPMAKELYTTVRDAYRAQADETDALLLDNVRKAQQIALNRAEAAYKAKVDDIRNSDMEEPARRRALEDAESKYKADSTKAKWAAKARLTKLRLAFENSRVEAPYFPLARFGRYFVTAKDIDGKVLHFSRHEKAVDQRQAIDGLKRALPNAKIESGVLEESGDLRRAMDPRVVAEIETLLGDAGVDDTIRDALWQRFLETMPDLSMRKNFIHRKGTAGYNRDAFRVFASNQFHAAHQIARLKYGLELQELVNDAADQAKAIENNNKEMTLVNEFINRDKWVRNPTGASFTNWVTSTAFVWYLAASPASAMVNATQTIMLGVPLLGAKFGIAKSSAALLRAAKEFFVGRADLTRANLSQDERAAMNAFYDSGLIDRTQSHDLAAIGETGTKYNPVRAKVMNAMSWAFHNIEVFNRSITALAAYRLAREAGQGHLQAINTAHERTYATHFDMSNSSRPAVLQNDFAKAALVFRSYQINMLYRLARDLHQSLKGESPQVRKEARIQFAGMMGMMATMAGVTGVPGYGLAMVAAHIFSSIFGDDDDDPVDIEDRFKDGIKSILGPELGDIVLSGAPGHYLGIDLTSRIGMPDLWFRSPNKDLQGREEWQYYVLNSLGASVSMIGDMFEGFHVATDENNVARGIETAAPKFVRDLMKSWRYAWEGVQSKNGDEVMSRDELSAYDLAAQFIGFTPSKIADRYEDNAALKNAEQNIVNRRRSIINAFTQAVTLGDDEARKEALQRVKVFNSNPLNASMAITGKVLKQSLTTRARNKAERVDGVLIKNKKLGAQLRSELQASPDVSSDE